MRSRQSTHSSGPQSPTPSIGEIEIPPPPPSDVEEMFRIGFDALDAIAASPVLDVELLPPPTTDSTSVDSSHLQPLDGPRRSSTIVSNTLPGTPTGQRHHDLNTLDLERGFWRVYHGSRELLRYATIYQQHRDTMHNQGHDSHVVNKPLIPREIDLESMTQLAWGVTRAVADINAYNRRMRMLWSGRNSGLASPGPEGRHHESTQRISKRKKRQGRTPSRVSEKHQQNTAEPSKTSTPIVQAQGQCNVCKECGTVHSPLWRYGPEGVRNLCNVCGLVLAKKTQRKMMGLGRNQEHRSFATASGSGGGGI
ncbi:hypothetical protein V8F20_007272 [Naviculisporaceae sp. PSN 640]